MEKTTFIITVIVLGVMLILLYFKSKDVEELHKQLTLFKVQVENQNNRLDVLRNRTQLLRTCYDRLIVKKSAQENLEYLMLEFITHLTAKGMGYKFVLVGSVMEISFGELGTNYDKEGTVISEYVKKNFKESLTKLYQEAIKLVESC